MVEKENDINLRMKCTVIAYNTFNVMQIIHKTRMRFL